MTPAPHLPAPGDVLVLDCEAAACGGCLDRVAAGFSPEDAARLASISSEPVRLAFATGRLLIGWLHRAAHDCVTAPRLCLGPHGKPGFADVSPWRFSLSHAGGRVALAVTRDHEVGIDLEHSGRRANFAALAERAFHANERAWWIGRGSQPADFLRMWTLKEAWLKTGGEGITVDLRALDVSPWIEGVSNPRRSSVFPGLDGGFLAAVVLDGELGRVQSRRVSMEDLIVPGSFPG